MKTLKNFIFPFTFVLFFSCSPFPLKKGISLLNKEEVNIEFYDLDKDGNPDFVVGYKTRLEKGKRIKEIPFGYWIDLDNNKILSNKECIIRNKDGEYRFMIPR